MYVREEKAAPLSLRSCWHWRVPETMLIASVESRLVVSTSFQISVWSGVTNGAATSELTKRPGGVSAFALPVLLRCQLPSDVPPQSLERLSSHTQFYLKMKEIPASEIESAMMCFSPLEPKQTVIVTHALECTTTLLTRGAGSHNSSAPVSQMCPSILYPLHACHSYGELGTSLQARRIQQSLHIISSTVSQRCQKTASKNAPTKCVNYLFPVTLTSGGRAGHGAGKNPVRHLHIVHVEEFLWRSRFYLECQGVNTHVHTEGQFLVVVFSNSCSEFPITPACGTTNSSVPVHPRVLPHGGVQVHWWLGHGFPRMSGALEIQTRGVFPQGVLLCRCVRAVDAGVCVCA